MLLLISSSINSLSAGQSAVWGPLCACAPYPSKGAGEKEFGRANYIQRKKIDEKCKQIINKSVANHLN